MTTVIFDISMSLDGYITAAHQTAAEPMGEGGEMLHQWAFGDDPANRELLASTMAGLGAVIAGRRTYDHSLPWWGADGPTGLARLPVVVVTHQAPARAPTAACTSSPLPASTPPSSGPRHSRATGPSR